MRTVIQGAGVLGSIFAAHLGRAGEDVVLLARGERAKWVRDNGIVLSGLVETTVPVTVETDPGALSSADLLVVTVKTYDTDSALAPLASMDVGAVLSVQNGVLKNEQLANVFGAEPVLGSIAAVSGEVMPDGTVMFTQNRGLYVGELPEGSSDRVTAITKMFQDSGIESVASPKIAAVEWSKFASWGAVMALSVLTRLETWKFCLDPQGADLAVAMIKEAAAIAGKLGIELDDSGPLPAATIAAGSDAEGIKSVQAVGERFRDNAPNHRMSTLQDLDHNKRLEIDETLGHILRLAREHDAQVPASRYAYDVVKTVDAYQGEV